MAYNAEYWDKKRSEQARIRMMQKSVIHSINAGRSFSEVAKDLESTPLEVARLYVRKATVADKRHRFPWAAQFNGVLRNFLIVNEIYSAEDVREAAEAERTLYGVEDSALPGVSSVGELNNALDGFFVDRRDVWIRDTNVWACRFVIVDKPALAHISRPIQGYFVGKINGTTVEGPLSGDLFLYRDESYKDRKYE